MSLSLRKPKPVFRNLCTILFLCVHTNIYTVTLLCRNCESADADLPLFWWQHRSEPIPGIKETVSRDLITIFNKMLNIFSLVFISRTCSIWIWETFYAVHCTRHRGIRLRIVVYIPHAMHGPIPKICGVHDIAVLEWLIYSTVHVCMMHLVTK